MGSSLVPHSLCSQCPLPEPHSLGELAVFGARSISLGSRVPQAPSLPSKGSLLCPGAASLVCGQLCVWAPPCGHSRPCRWLLVPTYFLLSLVSMAFQKRPQPTDFIDPLASKKPRISHFTQRAQPTLNGNLGAPNGHETLLPAPGPTPSDTLSSSHLPPRLEPPRLAPPRTHDPLADVSNDLGHGTQDCKHQEATPAAAPRLGLPLLTDFPQAEQPTGPSHTHSRPKKKPKKHRDKERPPEERPPGPQPDASAAPALPPDAPGQYYLVVSSRMWAVR